MALVTTTIEIDAPPQRVWDVVMDPRRLEDWVTIHRQLDTVSELPLARGSTLEQTLVLRGAHFKVRWEIDEISSPHHAVWKGRGPAHSSATIRYELAGPAKGPTKFGYANEFHTPGGVLGAVASRVFVGNLSQREAQRSLERLKALVESLSE
jgi:carbon monoxide dehydrogenase subunit G